MISIESQAHFAGPSEEPEGQPLLSSNILIHIGLRKSGTNWLRGNLFGSDKSGFWVPGDPATSGVTRGKEYIRQLFMDDVKRLLPDEDFDAAALRAQLEPLVVPAGKSAVFTAARLGGHPYSNGIDRGQLCNRFKQVFPDAHILIIIREQRSMILSSYIEHLKNGGASTMQNNIGGYWNSNSSGLTHHFFKYDRLVRLYQSAFGAENVLTLPMEMIRKTPQEYVNRICHLGNIETPDNMPFQIKSNARTTYLPYLLLRRVVSFIRSSEGNAYSPSIFGKKSGRTVHGHMINGLRARPKSS
jgi:hypothetical protein